MNGTVQDEILASEFGLEPNYFVYLAVQRTDCEGDCVLGVYDTAEKAYARCDLEHNLDFEHCLVQPMKVL